jgi:hypothetical protein
MKMRNHFNGGRAAFPMNCITSDGPSHKGNLHFGSPSYAN